MTRLQQFQHEVQEITRKQIRATMPEAKYIDAEFCSDIPNEWMASSWSNFKILSGALAVSLWLKENGFAKCKKSEATCLLMVGEKSESGCFQAGKHSRYWIKPKN